MIATDAPASRAREATRLRTAIAGGASVVDALLAGALLVLGWYILTAAVDRIPPAHDVFAACLDIVSYGGSYKDLWATLRRIVTSFLLAFAIGGVAGGLSGTSMFARSFLRPWVVVGMSAPMPVLIVTSVLIFGIGESSALIALTVSVAPFVATIVGDAVAGHDRQLDELGRVFRLSRPARLRHVLIPQITPALLAAGRTGFSLCWKLVVVVEALASSAGVGNRMHRDFKLLQTDRMIAWALVFTVVMKVVDVAVFQPVERRSLRWMRASRSAGAVVA